MARQRRRGRSGARSVTQAQTQAKIGGLPNVQYMREELRRVIPLYEKVRDCLNGSHAIKDAGDKYLPRPNAADDSDENHARYDAYLERAVFYNVTRRTAFALAGQIFLRDPQVDIPASLDVLKLDANGEGVTLEQVAQTIALYAICYGRAGLHADFPTTLSGITESDLANDDLRPTISYYSPFSIVNWRKALRGRRMVDTLIVVCEPFTVADDGFEAKTVNQYKVLRLLPIGSVSMSLDNTYSQGWSETFGDAYETAVSSGADVYTMEVWRGDSSGTAGGMTNYYLAERYFPRDISGNFLNEIPWKWVGAETNDGAVDHPPLADLAEINIGHYRNSADYEETSFLVGQPTPYVSGVTVEWNETVLKGNIQLGSRGVIALPNGGTAGLLQAAPNTVPKEAMDGKERQMVALGAKLVEQRQVQRTATEAQMEGTADTSILATIAQNVSNAVEAAVKQCCIFTGDDPASCSFVLNTEFDLTRMDPAERQELVQEWLAEAITTTEMRANLRRGGVATLDDTEYLAEAAIDAAKRLADIVTKTKAVAQAAPKPEPAPGNPGRTGE